MRRRWMLAIAGVVVLAIGWWIFVKVVYLLHGEYTSDLFTHYQMSKSWLEGKPLLWENCFGFHDRIHNYYLSVAIGLFTYPMGVWGLLVFQVLLMAGATAAFVASAVRDADTVPRWPVTAFLILFWLGPVSFYVWDDPYTGWHVENLYPALALLYALALQRRRWPVTIVSGMLLALVKEDGAVLGCCIGLASVLIVRSKPGEDRRRMLGRLAATVAVWGSLFVAGVLWLQSKSGLAGSPLGAILATSRDADRGELIRYLASALGWPALLTIAVLPVLLALVDVRATAALVLASAPLVIVNGIAGLWYYPDLFYATGWSPRVASLWGYWLSCLALATLERTSLRPGLAWKRVAALLGIALVAQCLALGVLPEPYPVFTRCCARPVLLLAGSADDPDRAFMNQLGERLPAGHPIAPPSEYFSSFRNQDIYWWDHPHPESQPETFICRGTCDVRFPSFDWNGKSRFRLGEFEFIADEEREHLIREQWSIAASYGQPEPAANRGEPFDAVP